MRNPVAEVLEATVGKMNEYHPVAEVLAKPQLAIGSRSHTQNGLL
jgi:hypothetical protein